MNPGTQIVPEALTERAYPILTGGTGTDLYLRKSVFHEAFAADLPFDITDQMQATKPPSDQERPLLYPEAQPGTGKRNIGTQLDRSAGASASADCNHDYFDYRLARHWSGDRVLAPGGRA
jgi:hypothetical protein